MVNKKKIKIIEEHYIKEWSMFSNFYTKRIIYINSEGDLDFLKFRIDKTEYDKKLTRTK